MSWLAMVPDCRSRASAVDMIAAITMPPANEGRTASATAKTAVSGFVSVGTSRRANRPIRQGPGMKRRLKIIE